MFTLHRSGWVWPCMRCARTMPWFPFSSSIISSSYSCESIESDIKTTTENHVCFRIEKKHCTLSLVYLRRPVKYTHHMRLTIIKNRIAQSNQCRLDRRPKFWFFFFCSADMAEVYRRNVHCIIAECEWCGSVGTHTSTVSVFVCVKPVCDSFWRRTPSKRKTRTHQLNVYSYWSLSVTCLFRAR